MDLNVNELICGDKFFVTLPDMQDEPVILGRTWQRKYNCFIDWPRRLAHCQSSNNRLWVPLRQPDTSYSQSIISIPTQLNSKEIPKRLPETQIKQNKSHMWRKVTNNSIAKKDSVKTTKQAKPELWKWICKQQHKEVPILQYKWIPKTPIASSQQSPKSVNKSRQF